MNVTLTDVLLAVIIALMAVSMASDSIGLG